MEKRITVQDVTEVPAEACVCHYDELDTPAKERFPGILGKEEAEARIDAETADAFRSCELIKFTDWYEVTIEEQPLS